MQTAAISVGVLGLLVVGLGLMVSLTRGATRTGIGYNPDPSDRLYKVVRAHGNATEFNPMLAILILYLGARGPAAWLEWTFVTAAVVRVLHAAGMLMSPSLANAQPLRFVGALGTYLVGLVLVGAVLLGG
jgi:uncharacterized membrane protein YecN with MAPEG domain